MSVKVCDWVNQFDPANINYDSLKLPTNLKSLNQYSDELVKDFPKLDITAELTFNKNSYRDMEMNSTTTKKSLLNRRNPSRYIEADDPFETGTDLSLTSAGAFKGRKRTL